MPATCAAAISLTLFRSFRTSLRTKCVSGSSTAVKLKGFSSNVHSVSLLSTSASAMSAHGNNKSRKASTSCMARSTKSTVEEDANGSSVGVEALSNCPSRLNTMTINELRTLARNVGIPPKGSKKALVSALSSFSTEGRSEGSSKISNFTVSAESDRVSISKDAVYTNEQLNPMNLTSKRKSRISSRGNDAPSSVSVPEVSKSRKKRSRNQKDSIDDVEKNLTIKSSTLQSNELEVHQTGTEMVDCQPWAKLAHKKPQTGWIPYNPKIMRPLHPTIDTKFVKMMSWNVNGLRALLKADGFPLLRLAEKEDFDVLCLQETKIKENDVEKLGHLIEGYSNSFWTCSVAKLGYSGTAIISRRKPISVKYGLGIPDHDGEGRLLALEFDKFYLINAYVPNSGEGLKRLNYRVNEWDPSLSRYLKELEQSKPVILTGDLNCAYQEIDIYNPDGNRRSAGFTNEERESFELNFLSKGFVDTFRRQHPNAVGYTYWGYRHGGRKTNKGWRLDYFLISESIADQAYDSYICPDIYGSDHCPIGLIMKL